ncbi:MAG TPA: PAS domain S-box protein, partial [Myxococcaceae bacterium]
RRAEEALRRSEAYLSEAQRVSHTGSFGWKVQGGEVQWSDETFRIFGFDPASQPTNERILERTHPDDRERVTTTLNAAVAERRDIDVEHRLLMPDGSVKYLRVVGHLSAREDGLEYLGAVTDVTERKRAERSLRGLLESAPDAIVVTDAQGGIVLVNALVEELFGYRREQLLGQPLETLVPERFRARHSGHRNAFFTQPHLRRLGEGLELYGRRSDGTEFPLEISLSPFEGEEGVLVSAAIRDITARKRSELALRRSEAYLLEAQTLTHTGCWAMDGKTLRPSYWSVEMFRMNGFDSRDGLPTLEQAMGRIHPDDRPRVEERDEKAIREGADADVEFRVLLPGGTVRYIYARAHPVLGPDGELLEVIGTNVDVTERKRAEEERARVRQLEADLAHVNRVTMLGELAASFAHELRQPLTAAIMNAKACKRFLTRAEPDLEEAIQAIERAVQDCNRAAEFISRLRALYKTAPAERELVDVNALVVEMLELMRSEAERHRIPMRTQLAAGLPRVRADRVQLQQVFLNLMLNGLEAMKDAGGELTIRTEPGADGQVLVSISDGGVGLPAEKADLIFEAFVTTKPEGSGMGLTISRSIIESHGGGLWATPNDGGGATFRFTLPTEDQKPASSPARKA